VLKALDTSAAALRARLGESLVSVQEFDVPMEATTPSLDALKAYSMGVAAGRTKGDSESVPYMKRAIELDPNFAMAYVSLGIDYSNLGQASLAADYARKAYDLRDRVSDRERFRISAFYFQYVTGEMDKAIEAYELWARSYPREMVPHANLAAFTLRWASTTSPSPKQKRRSVSDPLSPTIPTWPATTSRQPHQGCAADTTGSAEKSFRWFVSPERSVCPGIPCRRYRRDGASVTWALGRPGEEDQMLNTHADTQAYYGRMVKARDLARQAADSAVRADAKETAAQWLAFQAIREVEVGNAGAARQAVARALALAPGRDVRVLSALALARAGESTQSKAILEALKKSEPSNTFLKVYWFP